MAKGRGKTNEACTKNAPQQPPLGASQLSTNPSNSKKKPAATQTQSSNKRIKPSLLKGLTVIPPNKKDERSLQVIEALDNTCRSDAVRKKLEQWCRDPDVEGIRQIQGQRYELFVQVKKYATNNNATTNAFDNIVRDMLAVNHHLTKTLPLTVKDVRQILIKYAQQQAKEVQFISEQGYVFDNFSLLINYDACQSQYEHIDLQKPNVQCGLMVSDLSPPTRVFTCASIQTVQDLQQHVWKNIPVTLQHAIQNSPEATDLLQTFGDCLHPLPTEFPPAPPLERGSLMGLEGSRLHAGPACETYRCILFFSGSKPGSSIENYDPDTQYYAPLLVADWLDMLYDDLGGSDRRYLLDRLAKMMPLYENVHLHYKDGSIMSNFLKALAARKYGPGGKGQMLRAFSEKMDEIDTSSLTCVSVQGLRTNWKGTMYDITVYRATTTIHEPSTRVEVFWDGLPHAHGVYTLEMNTGGESSSNKGRRVMRKSKFDGTNGKLLDGKGKEIACFPSPS